MKILVTGAAGFIGSAVVEKLLARGDTVLGLDSLNAYYDVRLKHARLARIGEQPGFQFEQLDLVDKKAFETAFVRFAPNRVVHLAAQAGVRYSISNPQPYLDSNLQGFLNVLELCRHHPVEHLVYASSSSVYGGNTKLPFSIDDTVDHPISFYAVTKKANELMAHSYSHLFEIPTTGLRFFTVYGPWGRPDMAMFLFTKSILAGEAIDVFNYGKYRRDFTYVDDIVEGVVRVTDRVPVRDPHAVVTPATSRAPYRVYNIGNHTPLFLDEVISVLEEALGRQAKKNLLPMQPGDLVETFADVTALERDVGFHPRTSIRDGIFRFVEWYRSYYQV